MAKKKFFIVILIFDILILISMIGSLLSFGGAMEILKKGQGTGVVGFIIMLPVFLICLGASLIFSFINLPFCIISIKKSEKKVFSILSTILCGLIIIACFVLLIFAIINGANKPA